jgi:peptide methionine sulfoxide reductase MsrA
MTTLTKQDKIQIISSHLRNLEYRKYGIELDIMVEQAKATPVAEALAKHQEYLDEANDQIAVLNTELAAVNALTE